MTEAVHAAYCCMSDTVFEFEARDLFVDELFCPDCGARTAPEDRAGSLAEMRSRYPNAAEYATPLPLAQMRPHAR